MKWCPIFTPGGARICAVQPKKDLGEILELITEQGEVGRGACDTPKDGH